MFWIICALQLLMTEPFNGISTKSAHIIDLHARRDPGVSLKLSEREWMFVCLRGAIQNGRLYHHVHIRLATSMYVAMPLYWNLLSLCHAMLLHFPNR